MFGKLFGRKKGPGPEAGKAVPRPRSRSISSSSAPAWATQKNGTADGGDVPPPGLSRRAAGTAGKNRENCPPADGKSLHFFPFVVK